jgi:hypothetical protein
MPSGGRTPGSGQSVPPSCSNTALLPPCPATTCPSRSPPRASLTVTPTSPCGRGPADRFAWLARRARAEALARVAAGVPFRGWVVGHGWDANRWEEGPDRWVLDAVCPGPAYFDSLDVHAAWVNSAALGAAGIGRETPDPPLPAAGSFVTGPASRWACCWSARWSWWRLTCHSPERRTCSRQ